MTSRLVNTATSGRIRLISSSTFLTLSDNLPRVGDDQSVSLQVLGVAARAEPWTGVLQHSQSLIIKGPGVSDSIPKAHHEGPYEAAHLYVAPTMGEIPPALSGDLPGKRRLSVRVPIIRLLQA